jgi:2-polyprenyl-3-methyl-5-hydroxy-6-metoxy-1,4-benzoquinol methylase
MIPHLHHIPTPDARSRVPSPEEYVHEALAEEFDRALSVYDTGRRLEVLIDDFLPDSVVIGKEALDVGCGLGFFSERLVKRGGIVIACDLGPRLVERTRQRAGCRAVVADALGLVNQFGPNRFDVVVSSECIEHTPDPGRAIAQMIGVLRPGGLLSVSTPNVVWSPMVRFATATRLRPFAGLENFSSWQSMRRAIAAAGATILQERGLHLVPFQLPLKQLSRWCDDHLQGLRIAMINICILARKNQ